MSDQEWRYHVGAVEQGPIAAGELCRLFASGAVSINAMVWCAPISRWVPAASIPAFRQAAAAAPQGAHLPPPLPPKSPGGFFTRAAAFSWAAPIIAVVFAYGATVGVRNMNPGGPPDPKGLLCVGLVAAGFIIAGFLAGVLALAGAPRHLRRRILVPALVGVVLNGLAMLGGLFTATAARAALAGPSQIERDGAASVLNYPGWGGSARLPSGTVIALTTLDDASPTARRLLAPLNTRCSVVSIVFVGSADRPSVCFYEPASLILIARDGRTRAIPIDAIASRADRDAVPMLRRMGGLQAIPADHKPHEAVCFIPPGVDLTAVTAASITIDDHAYTIPGRLMTAADKQARFRAAH